MNIEASTAWSLPPLYGSSVAKASLMSSCLRRGLTLLSYLPKSMLPYTPFIAIVGIFYLEELKINCKLGGLVSFLVAKTKFPKRITLRKEEFILLRVQGCSPSWQGSHGMQLLTFHPGHQSVRGHHTQLRWALPPWLT